MLYGNDSKQGVTEISAERLEIWWRLQVDLEITTIFFFHLAVRTFLNSRGIRMFRWKTPEAKWRKN